MSNAGLNLGRTGEELAVAFLRRKGYKIIARNYKTRLGEIDIIASDADTLCFIEVKTRCSGRSGLPKESVTGSKQRQISKAAICFLKEKRSLDKKARFDVVSVRYREGEPELDVLKNAFELDERFSY
ncbi:MAG: YraN family protein [Candidatus Omnitrophica bacterium]|nr:YraN family protein [Candidatus Omnitrophota bacterium]